MRRIPFALAAIAAIVVLGMFVVPAASAKTTCAGGVFTGVNISGGLVVTGDCVYNASTISGGVTVTSTGGLELENNSSVSGGIKVLAGGELDAGHTLSSNTTTGTHSTISGGINSLGKDVDLDGTTVTGTTTLVGEGANFVPQICGSTLDSVNVSQVSGTFTQMHIGDPGEPFQAGVVADCPANTINGSLTLTDSTNVEIEGNTISGSVAIKDSTLVELAGNTIQGSASCTNVTPATDGDHTANTVGGSNNCP
jgi:hypothetical protein